MATTTEKPKASPAERAVVLMEAREQIVLQTLNVARYQLDKAKAVLQIERADKNEDAAKAALAEAQAKLAALEGEDGTDG